MSKQYTAEELKNMSAEALAFIVLSQQEQLKTLNANLENLIEQIRIANSNQYGRKSEKLDVIDGQMCLFNEAEAFSDPDAEEPQVEDVVKSSKRKKQKGKRDSDLEGFPVESHTHDISEEELNAFFGEGNWKEMPLEVFKRLRYEPARWTVEKHTVHVYVGTGGDHQDEFLRGSRPKDLLRNSIVTESLGAAVLNGKYVLALPLNRISEEFARGGLTLSRQTMANWVIGFMKYFEPLWARMKEHLLSQEVVQADETPVLVVQDGREGVHNSYMWVHRSSELCKEKPVVLYEYQKTRHHEHPLEFYKDFKGVLETDGLQQYHLLEEKLPDLVNANCWTHARRDFADACKAIGKSNTDALKMSVAHQALELIARIFHEDEMLKDLSSEERLKQRQIIVKPLVEAYFAWVREQIASNRFLPKGKTMQGLNYCLNHEKQLKIFLENGDVPIDNSASERSIRPFCLGKKNWVLINSVKGARASAVAYSIAESAKLNQLKPYEYFKYLLSELPYRMDSNGNIDPSTLDNLMPWSKDLSEDCYKRR